MRSSSKKPVVAAKWGEPTAVEMGTARAEMQERI